MAGASDPSIAFALEEQSKSLKAQDKSLDSTQKLLQRICDCFDAQDARYRILEASMASQAADLTTLRAGEGDAVSSLRADLEHQVVSLVAEIESSMWDRVDAIAADASTRMAALENVHAVFESWRPRIENSVDSVRAKLSKVAKLLEHRALAESEASPGILGVHQAVAERQSTSTTNVTGPNGHRAAQPAREVGVGYVYTQHQLPDNGMPRDPYSQFIPHTHANGENRVHNHYNPYHNEGTVGDHLPTPPSLGHLPKLNFPPFDGDNPKLWQARCVDYFYMYGLPP
jgi:hypothetical protein